MKENQTIEGMSDRCEATIIVLSESFPKNTTLSLQIGVSPSCINLSLYIDHPPTFLWQAVKLRFPFEREMCGYMQGSVTRSHDM
jgi:hypothetical protein